MEFKEEVTSAPAAPALAQTHSRQATGPREGEAVAVAPRKSEEMAAAPSPVNARNAANGEARAPGSVAHASAYRVSPAAARSWARYPARMPSMPRLPSWQAYSNSGSSLRRSGIITVQGRVHVVESSNVIS